MSQAARTLGRIVLLARQSKAGVGLDGIIQPENFDLVGGIGCWLQCRRTDVTAVDRVVIFV